MQDIMYKADKCIIYQYIFYVLKQEILSIAKLLS